MNTMLKNKTKIIFLLFLMINVKVFSQNKLNDNEVFKNNFDLSIGYSINDKFFDNNHIQLKLNIDLIEAWISKIGFSSFLCLDFGWKNEEINQYFFTTLYVPGLGLSYKILPNLIGTGGLSFIVLNNYKINGQYDIDFLSTGIAFPIKLRYYLFNWMSLTFTLDNLFFPWISSVEENLLEKKWDYVTKVNLGITITIPSRI